MARIEHIERVEVAKLIPYKNNAKKHSKLQVEKLVDSMREFGVINPILIDENYNVIAGHGRLEALKQMGETSAPCLFVEGLSETQRRAYILADNRLAEVGIDWDYNILDSELAELSIEDFDVDITGFEFDPIDGEEFGTDFSLPDGDKPTICQMTFTLHEDQKALIQYALETVADDICETFGNTNKNGNALYEVVRQWAEQRK